MLVTTGHVCENRLQNRQLIKKFWQSTFGLFLSKEGVMSIIDRKYRAVTLEGIVRTERCSFEKLQIGLVYDHVKFRLF